jgi:uncharacterized protein (TIRG00374 family)
MKAKLNLRMVNVLVAMGFLAAGLLVVILDRQQVQLVINRANWRLVIPAVMLTAVSYICLSYSSAIIFRIFGNRLGLKDLLRIGFVATVMTFTLNIGGITGTSVEFLLLKERGISTEDILAPSLFQLYFSGIMLAAILPIGLFELMANPLVSGGGILGASIATAGIALLYWPFRSFILNSLGSLVNLITRHSVTAALNDFNTALTRGVAVLRQQPTTLAILLLLAVVDWASTIAALWFCFAAIGEQLSIGTLMAGFSLGITAGFVSFIPGGLGVQEGSMAGIFGLMGVPVSTAFLGAILFRIVYYLVPFIVSLGCYRRLLRRNI